MTCYEKHNSLKAKCVIHMPWKESLEPFQNLILMADFKCLATPGKNVNFQRVFQCEIIFFAEGILIAVFLLKELAVIAPASSRYLAGCILSDKEPWTEALH